MSGDRFANFSHLSGLGLNDDGRALAVCDWDRDGDQDIWLRNRNAPRLRLMLNASENNNASVSLCLEGVSCNRDAIGAKVSLKTNNGIMIRSLRAGEMFLSQSTKCLHFGMGANERVRNVVVSWPGGGEESFLGVKRGSRYLLKEGKGVAIENPLSQEISFKTQDIDVEKKSLVSDYIYLPVEVPFPRLSYRAPDAKMKEVGADVTPLLVTFWESSSDGSATELILLEKERVRINSLGFRALALSVDGIESAGMAYDLISESKYKGDWGFITEDLFGMIKRWQRALFERYVDIEFPFSLLLTGKGNCVAIYRSHVSDALIKDMPQLVSMDSMTRWHNAPLLRGSWFTNPVSKDYVRSFIEQRIRK